MKWSTISAVLAAPLAFASVVSAGVAAKRAGPIIVTVGNADGALVYDPSSLTGLNAGDVIRFQLAPGSSVHSITQAVDANDPCTADPNGVNHTFDPSDPSSTTFDQTVIFTDPFYAFCNVPGHCEAGMKFTVNAP